MNAANSRAPRMHVAEPRSSSTALAQNTTLRALDLTQNDLGVQGAVALGRALEVNTTLARLNVRANRIGYGLARASGFANALATNESLTWLDVSQVRAPSHLPCMQPPVHATSRVSPR